MSKREEAEAGSQSGSVVTRIGVTHILSKNHKNTTIVKNLIIDNKSTAMYVLAGFVCLCHKALIRSAVVNGDTNRIIDHRALEG